MNPSSLGIRCGCGCKDLTLVNVEDTYVDKIKDHVAKLTFYCPRCDFNVELWLFKQAKNCITFDNRYEVEFYTLNEKEKDHKEYFTAEELLKEVQND